MDNIRVFSLNNGRQLFIKDNVDVKWNHFNGYLTVKTVSNQAFFFNRANDWIELKGINDSINNISSYCNNIFVETPNKVLNFNTYGEMVWEIANPDKEKSNITEIIIDAQSVYFCYSTKGIRCIDLYNGEEKWYKPGFSLFNIRSGNTNSTYSSNATIDTLLFKGLFAGNNKNLHLLDCKNGHIITSFSSGFLGNYSPLIEIIRSEGKLICLYSTFYDIFDYADGAFESRDLFLKTIVKKFPDLKSDDNIYMRCAPEGAYLDGEIFYLYNYYGINALSNKDLIDSKKTRN